MQQNIIFILVVIVCIRVTNAKFPVVLATDLSGSISIENGFVKLMFNKVDSTIDFVSADFSGLGLFTKNVLSSPFRLEVTSSEFQNCSTLQGESQYRSKITWVSRSQEFVSFRVNEISDCVVDPFVSESWLISLERNMRSITLEINGSTLKSGTAVVLHGIYTINPSVYGLFDRGLTQMMNNNLKCLGSQEPMSRAYMLGNGGALDILRGESKSGNVRQVVLMSKGVTRDSGLQDIVIGSYPSISMDYNSAWSPCWKAPGLAFVEAGFSWNFQLTLIPNNFDFPAFPVRNAAKQPDMPFLDMQTFLTGIYASPVGCLQSYYSGQDGTIAPTISHPDVGYSPDTNFFDPDNFIALSAMMYSGDDYILGQVRAVIEKTGETMCGIGSLQLASYCSESRQRLQHKMMSVPRYAVRYSDSSQLTDKHNATQFTSRSGQLMHHFITMLPTYDSIAGSEQLGPNVFWTMTVLRYASLTQDYDWALKMFPFIDLSTHFLLTFFDESKDLISAPGPLWIDVIVRENFTTDSNAILVPLLLEIADFYDYLDVDADFATLLRDISARISVAMNEQLWAVAGLGTGEDDHFITQLNPDGSSRDFIDFDSNLIAVAFGIASEERSKKILKRVDGYEYSHIRATWCSEKPYSGDREDCYIVGGTVCGDSVVTLARIGWVDALARKRVGDLATFDDLLLAPLQRDLVENVWLYERYDSYGRQIRTSYYFEYPAFVAMMLREIRYGIIVGLSTVEISPLRSPGGFTYAFGNVRVQYSQDFVSLVLPGEVSVVRPKLVSVSGMYATTAYTVKTACKDGAGEELLEFTDEAGVLTFSATFSDACMVTAAVA